MRHLLSIYVGDGFLLRWSAASTIRVALRFESNERTRRPGVYYACFDASSTTDYARPRVAILSISSGRFPGSPDCCHAAIPRFREIGERSTGLLRPTCRTTLSSRGASLSFAARRALDAVNRLAIRKRKHSFVNRNITPNAYACYGPMLLLEVCCPEWTGQGHCMYNSACQSKGRHPTSIRLANHSSPSTSSALTMPLPTRKIGTSNVTAIGYGAMGIAGVYGTPPKDEERLQLLDEVYKHGCLFWDTADIYFDSEDLIGKWFVVAFDLSLHGRWMSRRFRRSGKRDEIFLATKFGCIGEGDRLVNGTPEYVRQACEQSLRRLGVDQIDLYYYHRPDPTTPIELTVGAMAELVK